MITISVVGKVSVGKSSFVNSLHYLINEKFGNFEWLPATTVSIKRETFQPINLIFGLKQDHFDYAESQKHNTELRSNNPETIKFVDRHVLPDNPRISKIIDFPGFDDIGDGRDCMSAILDNMSDLTIFVTDASRAFIDKSEFENFEIIRKKSEKLNSSGRRNELLIVVNKFDHMDQSDLLEIYNEIPATVKKFRWCSYAVLKNNLFRQNIYASAVTAPCDIDTLMNHIFVKNDPNTLTVLDFIPHESLLKIGAELRLGSLRLVYKYLESSDISKNLNLLPKLEISKICRNLRIPATGDKNIMIKKITEVSNANDEFVDIFKGVPKLDLENITTKLGINFPLYEYYKFFGLAALENWTIPYLSILAKSLGIKVTGKKKSELLEYIINVARN
jgi:GTPase Era involved in 16S rRNA processing